MKHLDDKIKKRFDDFKNNLEINNEMERRVMRMVKKRDAIERRKKILLGLAGIAVARFLVISSVALVFGRNETLPQVITNQ